ncbi:hypothetical protein BT63DRAFT_439704 [Microthyrium microscopicum]|uniref:CENP-V/GFA domain-containing protein n=1 Tax=Microthyrium microscopicum TaxID=703497 RepID=A0A6A6UCW1_9PEZI|nr:hypothetical protein BT63DRAFT_439704 [Microthyrium microscopicum]
MPLRGECNCGAIVVAVQDPKEGQPSTTTAHCHCTNCRRQSGGNGTYIITKPESEVTVSGTPKAYIDNKTTSGVDMKRWFCGDCGSPVMSTTPAAPGMIYVKMGLFDKVPRVAAHLFTKSKLSWEPSVEGATQFETSP